jgi:hypothetical protein
VIEAVASHLVFFYENDALSERSRGGGKRKSAGARADDAEIRLDQLISRCISRPRGILEHDGLSAG